MENFWSIIWIVIWSFVFVAYLFVLFYILTDLFRDHQLSGWWKALWIIFLIFAPYLTALVYVIARGKGMAERQQAYIRDTKTQTDAYIRDVAGKSPAESIADAKALLDSGTITQQEFDRLKAKALARRLPVRCRGPARGVPRPGRSRLRGAQAESAAFRRRRSAGDARAPGGRRRSRPG